MISLQTNVNSLVAQQNLSVNSAFQSKTIAQLTSGYRINQSGDDAAGLAVANKFRSTVAELTQGVANGNDATAQLQIMDGGMSNISMILDRLKTLATQSASGTFTGNRTVLNAEFQNALSEIDRQAQSIGLNTGGLFAKNLDVFLGVGSGSTSLQNGIVILGLTQSAVDSQALGMKGMQAVAGTADIGTGSATSVALIVADVANTGSTATAGTSDFYFVGSGFSDAGKVKVSVNLSGVSDTATLVTAFNSALTAAGTGTSQASAAFAAAGIVASAHTDASGGQQLAFTSSTKAFQVEAGDQMANALMGYFASGTTGHAITETLTGGATALSAVSFTPATQNVTVRIQGAGLASPVDLVLNNTSDPTVGQAITDLGTQVSSNTALKAAGISVSGGTAGSPLVFTSARGESINVMATGDTTNQLGMGAFVTGSGGAVDYSSIIGTSFNYGTANNDQSTMQVSINGAAATNLALDLTGGNAVAAARTGSIISNPTITAGTASSATGTSALVTHDWSVANNTFTVNVNGGGAQSVTVATNFTLGGNNAALLTEINGQLTGVTATINGTDRLVFTANAVAVGNIVVAGTQTNIGTGFAAMYTTGANANNALTFSVDGIQVDATLSGAGAAQAAGTGTIFANNATKVFTAASSGASTGSADVTVHDFTAGGPVTFTVTVDGGIAQTVSLSGNLSSGALYASGITSQLVGATATYDGVANRLSITSNTTGTGSSIALGGAGSGTSGFTALGSAVTSHDFTNSSQTFTVNGGDGSGAHNVLLNGSYTDASAYVNRINAQAGTWVHAAVGGATNNEIQITSLATGVTSNITLTAGNTTEAQVVGSGALADKDYSGGGNSRTISVTTADHVLATVTLTTHDITAQNYVDDINLNNSVPLVGFHAAVVNGNVAIISEDGTSGSGSTLTLAAGTATLADLGLTAGTYHGNDAPVATFLGLTVGAGTAGEGPAVATYLHLAAGTTGLAGNNQLMVSSDLHGPALVTIAADTYGDNTATTIQRAVNNALVSAGLLDSATTPTSGVVATLDALGNLDLTSTTVGAASGVSIAAPPSVSGTVSSALDAGGIGIAAGSHVGTSATATSLANQIQSAIDAATKNGAAWSTGDAHATATANFDGSITITNDIKGDGHAISAFTGTAATGAVSPLVSFMGTGSVNVIAGANRTGSDMASYLNGFFSSTAAIQPAQLTATWAAGAGTAGTLTIASGNGTNFRINAGTTATASMSTSTTNLSGGVDFLGAPTAANKQAFQISSDHGGTWKDIVLNTDTTAAGVTGAQNVVDALNTALTAASAGVTASLVTSGGNYYVKLASDTVGGGASIQLQNYSAADATAGYSNALATGKILDGLQTREVTADANLGFGVSGASFASTLTSASQAHIVDAGGASSANSLLFSALKYGNDAQAITVTGNDGDGNQQAKTITLQNLTAENRAGRNIDQAIGYINAQLLATNNATLQKITAVKETVSGVDKINFISSLSAFNVGVASTANADGVNAGVSKNVQAGVVGDGANMQVDTKEAAKSAVTALAAAIAQLGSAQAAVGKGQNQLYYAVNLANSQITNFSAAESYLRDANVAQQAANLTKAQVLSQASIAAMAQANSAPQAILSLLRG